MVRPSIEVRTTANEGHSRLPHEYPEKVRKTCEKIVLIVGFCVTTINDILNFSVSPEWYSQTLGIPNKLLRSNPRLEKSSEQAFI